MHESEVDTLFDATLQKLKKHWGYDQFRPGQDDAILSVLEGKETLVLFPTGGGKSLCYQVPALVLKGVTVVISPLVALMEDQVEQLHQRNVTATFINSNLKTGEIEQRLVNARNGMYKLLYCAPERLSTPLFQHEMDQLQISMIAVDEAHCISEWGHDFRPQYRLIREALEPIEDKVRWLALTATATPEVRDDILEVLRFKKPNIISKGFERPNLKWWVYSGSSRMKAIERMVTKYEGSGLVYAGTRKLCNELAVTIQLLTGKITAAYHAGLDGSRRSKVQEAWIKGGVPVVVATNAFGMGIDKSDCRYVIHHDPPGSLEAYYQEAGRAGRDGELSFPLLCYRPSDIQKLRTQIIQNYPTLEELYKIYSGVCDSLNLAIGSVMEQPQPIEIESVEKRTKLSKRLILGGIKVLDSLRVFDLITEYSNQVGVQFMIGVDSIRSLRQSSDYNEKKAVFIENLFRIFGPESMNELVYVSINHVVERTELTFNQVLTGLDVLLKEQILTYRLADGKPVIKLRDVRESKPTIDRKTVENFRNILLKKLDYMRGYSETGECRSRYLRIYFGEQNPAACGICDNCMKAKKKLVIPETSNLKKLKEILKSGEKNMDSLVSESGINGMALFKALSWMSREGMVSSKWTKNGEVFTLK